MARVLTVSDLYLNGSNARDEPHHGGDHAE
jgi:hypothetical protein